MLPLRFFFAISSILFSNLGLSSDYGVTGLIDVPNARMLEDGDLKVAYSTQNLADISSLTYQVTPWLESSLRYTIFNPNNPNRGNSGIDGLNDRSYSFKLRLMEESKFIPQISLGIHDFLGTGILSSEYLVSSKRYGNLDLTLGFGWGRLSDRESFSNPLGFLGDRYKSRQKVDTNLGGKNRLSSFFTGDTALFGGISYAIPKLKLVFNAEYNSDSYKREVNLGTIRSVSPVSYGLTWSYNENLDIALSHQHADQSGLSFSYKLNTKETLDKKRINPYFSATESKATSMMSDVLNRDLWYDRLFFDLDKSGILLKKARVNDEMQQVDIEIMNFQYQLSADAINRALTLSELHIPRYYKNLNVILNETGYQPITISYRRQSNPAESNNSKLTRINILKPRKLDNPLYTTRELAPHINFGAGFDTRFQFFDPQKPIKYQLYLALKSDVNLGNGWSLFGKYAIDVKNTFDQNRKSNSVLPRVRTEIDRYLDEGHSGVMSLYLQKNIMLTEQLYSRIFAGILEEMYMGLGGEILYMPFRSRWAIGAAMNRVRKRDYDMSFKLLDYESTTGFISLYYASSIYNLDFGLHFGKYLAGDRGHTIDIRRSFDSGFTVGAFATFTDVSSEDFGEGSFDKGLNIVIPFNSFFRGDTKSTYSTKLRSIQRDGGQKLDDFSGKLWYDLRNVRYDSFERNKLRMLP